MLGSHIYYTHIINDQEEPLNLRYNLRQNRRQPERYGVPVMNY